MPINFKQYCGQEIFFVCPTKADVITNSVATISSTLRNHNISRESNVVSGSEKPTKNYSSQLARELGTGVFFQRPIDRAGLNPHLTRSTGEVALFAVSAVRAQEGNISELEVLSRGLVICIESPFVNAFAREGLIERLTTGLYSAKLNFEEHESFDARAVRTHGGCALAVSPR